MGARHPSGPPWPPAHAATVPVTHASGAYDVVVGSRLLGEIGRGVRGCAPAGSGRAVLVTDDRLPPETVRTARRSLEDAGFVVAEHALHASEPRKSINTLQRLLVGIAEARLERDDPIVALGGGIVGDLAGFAAATYRRGVPLVQCPTTLLAMVDASVGGKTGVNLDIADPGGARRLVKNLVGAFHQPRLVAADIDALRSLDERDFTCGLAECVKHAMIGSDWDDPTLFGWIEHHAADILARDPATVAELVERNVRIKARVVAADERETTGPDAPGRMLLNLGHTFGHAIETMEAVAPEGLAAPPRHGEAVALGLVCACRCATELGADAEVCQRLRTLLEALGLPTHADGLPDPERVIEAMRDDKKAGAGRMRLVLPGAPGHARVVEDPPLSALRAAVEEIRA